MLDDLDIKDKSYKNKVENKVLSNTNECLTTKKKAFIIFYLTSQTGGGAGFDLVGCGGGGCVVGSGGFGLCGDSGALLK